MASKADKQDKKKETYAIMAAGDFFQAKKSLLSILESDFENPEIEFAHWCCTFWNRFLNENVDPDGFSRGSKYLSEWKNFKEELKRKKNTYAEVCSAVQSGVFASAEKCFSEQSPELIKDNFQRAEFFRKLGVCRKQLGKYGQALEELDEATALAPGQADILAERADCFALCGKECEAKILFREAFFLDARKIALEFLDSELIKSLIQSVEKKGYTGEELQYWIPVYGVLYGVLNVSRDLRSLEVATLKQNIFETEIEIRNPGNNIRILKPKLLNMYFRLMDYYVQKNDAGRDLKELLLKIKILDTDVYRQYVR